MSNRVAIVTGGTRGIGGAISIALKQADVRVAATYAGNDDAARAFSDETGIPTYKFDVAEYEACTGAVAQIEKDLGPVEILVNNAGITWDAPFHKMAPEAWTKVIETDLTSAYNMTHAVWSGMRDRGFGRIVNISSINGQKGQFTQANYSAAKAGLMGFTKALAAEGARKGITVNTICPGYIDTDMMKAVKDEVLQGIIAQIPVGRLGRAEEVARGVLFLVDDDAGFVTGSTVSINGGQHMY
ncbi:MAG: acetoacetyl-CoA reductase [Rhodothalassiaceae bacterium]